MDRYFLEFWGNLLLSAAKGQKQLDDATLWMRQNFGESEELTALFKQIYGLERLSDTTSDYNAVWQQASEAFQQSLKEYLRLFDVVPVEDYEAVVSENEQLKQQVQQQQETIERLRGLLSSPPPDQSELLKSFQDLMAKQSKQFQDLVESSGQFLKESLKGAGKKPPPK